MLVELKLPESGMGMTEGTIIEWKKAAGDTISAGEVLVEVETAKAVTEVTSPIDGVLREILFPAGSTAEVHATLAILQGAPGAIAR
jgi:pyruvate/2-oxoglutarate dehydrogenase complex dihydrolipoamide acyltransferase (E2) component